MKLLLSGLRASLVITLLFTLSAYSVMAQYGPNDYVLSTQAQVDAFTPSVLQGKNLVISGSDITNINKLTNLIRVNGLVIENNPMLTSLAPLNNVDSIKGELRIDGNAVLTNLDMFTGLKYVLGLTISANGSLTSIGGFNALLTITEQTLHQDGGGRTLTIDGNESLLTITGFNALPFAPRLVVNDNIKLTAITGFHALTFVHWVFRYPFGTMDITNNDELTNIDGFLSITDLDALTIRGNKKLKNLHGLSNWASIHGTNITISYNDILEDLDGLSNLTVSTSDQRTSPSTNVYLDHNPLLTKPCGIYKILDKLDYLFNADRVHIEGSGFHMYQLLSCGPPTTVTIPPAPLIALNFNEGAGIAPSSSGELGATFSRSAGTPLSTTNAPTNVGGAGSFDFGTTTGNYYVESASPVDGLKNLNAFTLTGWLNTRSNTIGGGGNRVISWINNGGEGVDLIYQANGSLRLGVDGWADGSPAFSSAAKVPTSASAAASNWVFFAVTYQSTGQVEFYFGNSTTDATLDVAKSYVGPGVTGSAIGKLAIGAFNDATRNSSTYNSMFRGLIDEVQVFGTNLNYEKILGIQHAVGTVILPSKPIPVLVSKTSTSATLQWPYPSSTGSATTAINGYVIYDNGVLLSDGVTIGFINGGGGQNAVITGLLPSSTHKFVVRALTYNEINYVESDPLTVTTDPAAIATLHLEAENYNGFNGIVKQATTIESTDGGDWIRFDNVNLGAGFTTIATRYAKGNNVNGTATVRLGNPTTGTLIGTLNTSYTGSWGTYTTTSAPLTGASGVQTVYVSWPSGSGNGNYDWFEFSGPAGSGDTTPPSAPSNVSAVSISAVTASLSWSASTDNVGVTGYEIYNNSTQLVGTSSTNTVTVTNLSPNTEYVLSVKAKDAANNYSPFSNSVYLETGLLTSVHLEAEAYNTASGIVKQATTIESTDGGDWIRFDNVQLSTGYAHITTRYAKGNTGTGTATIRLGNPTTGTLIGTLATPSTGGWGTFTTTTALLTGGTGVQTVYVSWPSGSGNGNYDWFEFTDQTAGGDTTPPTAPSSLVLVSKTANSVSVSWNASSDNVIVSGYEVYNNSTQLLGTSATTSLTLTNLTPNTAYSLTVKAKDDANNYSTASNTLAVITNATLPTLHIEAESYNGSNGIVKQAITVESTDAGDWIRFDNVNLGTGYATITTRYAKGNNVDGSAVIRLGNPVSGTIIGTLITHYTAGWGTFTTASAPLTGASGLQTVYVTWPTGEGNGNFDWFEFSNGGQSGSGRVDMSVASSTQVAEDEEKITNELVQNYPNPFEGETQIGVSLSHEVRVAKIIVNDITGRSLKNIDLQERGKFTVKMDGTELVTGVYMYSLIVDGRVVGLKRMIVHK